MNYRNPNRGFRREELTARSCREVARIMTERGYKMSRQSVLKTEYRALEKLRAGLADLEGEL